MASSSSRATCSGQNDGALPDQAVDIGRRCGFRRLDRDRRDARGAVDVDADKAVLNAVFVDGALQRRQGNALAVTIASGFCGEFLGALGDLGLELAVRHDLVDQAPCDGALALDAFLDGAEEIGMVAAHFSLVDHAGQAAGARQHREQRHFRQRHRRRAVVGEHDVVGRQREFIAAAGRGAVDDGDETLAGIFGGIFQPVAGLVGEFAEVDLVGMGRARQHADVGAGAEHAVLAGAHHHRLHFGMLETQPLHGVRQLDVDAEVVGIELELIALEQAAVLVDVHRQRRDVACDVQLPVPVTRRIGLKIDVLCAARERAIFTSHWGHPEELLVCHYMHNNACFGARLVKNARTCILFHPRPTAENDTQSALVSWDLASRAFSRPISASAGKPSAKPSPAALALRAFSAPAPRALRPAAGRPHAACRCAAANWRWRSGCRPAAGCARGRLGGCGPHRLQHFLGFPEIAALVERDAVTQRRVPRRHVVAKPRRHQRFPFHSVS